MIRLLTTLLLLCPVMLIAQTEGRALYKKTVKMDPKRLERVPEEFRDRIPKEFTSESELLYNSTHAIYKRIASEQEGDSQMGRRGMRFRMGRQGGQDDQTYVNLEENRRVEYMEFFDKKYLIKEELPAHDWKITGNKAQHEGMLVMEATTEINDSTTASAWFAPQIPVSIGPEGWSGLPGLIVRVEERGGMSITELSSIEDWSEEMSIDEPTKGKEMTREEFRAMRDEKMEEMRKMREARGDGPGGRRVIIRG